MNARFLIFVLLVTSTLLIANRYFTPTPPPTSFSPQTEEVVASESPPTPLPTPSLVPLYKEVADPKPTAWAFPLEDHAYLTLSPHPLPSLFFKDDRGKFQELHLQSEGDVQKKGGPLIYTLPSHSSSPSLPLLPSEKPCPVKAISTEDPTQIVEGEYDQLSLIFSGPSEPKQDSLILYFFENRYLPIGTYTPDDRSFHPLDPLLHKEDRPDPSPSPTPLSSSSQENPTFYVLENGTMQLVFSTLGGAIAEVNLPLKSNQHPQSVVLPIDLDRMIRKQNSLNSRFPHYPYYVVEKGTPTLKHPSWGGYYPLLRRNLCLDHSSPPLDPRFYAFNTISKEEETPHVTYKVISFSERSISFEGRDKHRKITKTYTLPEPGQETPYCLKATIQVDGDSRLLWVTSGIPEVELISGSPTPTIKYHKTQNQKSVVEKLSLPKTSASLTSFSPEWIANSNGYFALIYDPLQPIGSELQVHAVPGHLAPSRILLQHPVVDRALMDKYPGYELYLPLKQGKTPAEFRLYFGPLESQVLKKVDQALINPRTGRHPNYLGTQSFHGWFAFISEPFAKFLFWIMQFFYRVTHSWGFSIILLTFVLRIMMYPLNAWSIKSTLQMQEMSPKVKKLQDKYKKDPKRAQMEIMQFYKKHKVNPFGGCLPLLIQMPFLFGMFDLLKSTFSLRGASFIPGWIDNLTAPDVLFSWATPLPVIGNSLHLLPLILGVAMFLQQKFSNTSGSKNLPLTDAQKQQQKMGAIMTTVFTFVFYKFPSGLNLYCLSSMLLQIAQQWFTSMQGKQSAKRSQVREIVIEPPKNRNA